MPDDTAARGGAVRFSANLEFPERREAPAPAAPKGVLDRPLLTGTLVALIAAMPPTVTAINGLFHQQTQLRLAEEANAAARLQAAREQSDAMTRMYLEYAIDPQGTPLSRRMVLSYLAEHLPGDPASPQANIALRTWAAAELKLLDAEIRASEAAEEQALVAYSREQDRREELLRQPGRLAKPEAAAELEILDRRIDRHRDEILSQQIRRGVIKPHAVDAAPSRSLSPLLPEASRIPKSP